MKLHWPAPERNKGPLLELLARVLPRAGFVLEIASGSGQHVVHFAQHLRTLRFQPSDVSDENLASIRAWVEESRLENVSYPIQLDVRDPIWPVAAFDAAFCANMIHIAPWECAIGLFDGMRRHLAAGGLFVLYGPFRVGGAHTAPSNALFDADLRRRNAGWGVRDLEAIDALAAGAGLVLTERIAMPANNQSLVFMRT